MGGIFTNLQVTSTRTPILRTSINGSHKWSLMAGIEATTLFAYYVLDIVTLTTGLSVHLVVISSKGDLKK